MAFFEIAKEFITNKPPNLKGPHFYKADSDLRAQLEQLKEFYKTAPDYIKPQVEQDIKMLHYGIAGEEQVAFELNNSFIPMIVLHDLHLEYEGLTSQIDFMIITTKLVLVVECKNLYGNIEVNNRGEFIRTFEYKGKLIKEGIYSPITQNARHLDMIKKIRLTSKNNFLARSSFLKYFEETYKSVVVLANPKTVIDLKYAKKEVKDQIIRCDQLVGYIKKLLKDSGNEAWFEKQMYELADFFLSFHTPNTKDYTRKYVEGDWKKKDESEITKMEVNLEETPLYKELRQYRYEISRAAGLKPYMVFTNAEM
ncbi:MAG TPA: helicase, partial [Clostridia bacterium]|nr:helicase [Clostridia bacterium]